MRISKIHANDIVPIKIFDVDNLTDLVVLAGPNGVGKTRLMQLFISAFRSAVPNCSYIIEATNDIEQKRWGKSSINTSIPGDRNLLTQLLQANKKRRNFTSSVLYYESNRTIAKVNPYQFTWDIPDPWEENVGWDLSLNGLKNRFPDTIQSIFKKIQSQRSAIAIRAEQLRKEGYDTMSLEFQDILNPFREIFYKLLAPKTLDSADLKSQDLRCSYNGNVFSINSLSSGEREVLNISFDFLLRNPSDCIVFFDEPELHLHPELAMKLITTLRSIGKNNQLILATHSSDIISSSLDETVIAVKNIEAGNSNQAQRVKTDDDTIDALNVLGHSVGIISLGKKIVLIEGRDSSLDKKTYMQISNNEYRNLVFVPSSGKETIKNFSYINEKLLSKSVWGIDFYMLTDRDVIPLGFDVDSNSRFRTLKRYHLENYFLDEDVLASIFCDMEDSDSDLCKPEWFKNQIKEIAVSRLYYSTALIISKYFRTIVGNIDIMPKGNDSPDVNSLITNIKMKADAEKKRMLDVLDMELETKIREVYARLEDSINKDDDVWKEEIPGKQIMKILSNRIHMDEGRLKNLYIRKAIEIKPSVFNDIYEILGSFSA